MKKTVAITFDDDQENKLEPVRRAIDEMPGSAVLAQIFFDPYNLLYTAIMFVGVLPPELAEQVGALTRGNLIALPEPEEEQEGEM